MLITKTVQVEFANTEFKAVNHIADIRKAAENARLHLFSKYDVRLEMPRVINDYQVVMEVRIPDDIVDNFQIGNHLRGISAYLLKYCDSKYENAVVGKRLLSYTVLSDVQYKKSDNYNIEQKLSLISQVINLLKSNDSLSLKKIEKIKGILAE